MFMHRISLTALAVMTVVTITTSTLRADTLADGFNAFFFGDFAAPHSDVEGRLAVGGNANIAGGYSVGDKLTGAMVGGNTLVVGGDLYYGNGQVFHGNTIVGGTYTGTPHLSPTYTVTDNVSPMPVNFNAVKQDMIALSAQLAAMNATGTDVYQWSTLNLTGDGVSNVQVFNIDGNDVKSASDFKFITGSAPTDATLIFNISGTNPELKNMGISGLDSVRENVIFNFYEATSLLVEGVGVQGSILAPHAHIQAPHGVVWGQVIANSWNGAVQINQVYFAGELPIPDPYEEEPNNPGGGPDGPVEVTAMPEPASAAMWGLGMLAVAAATRRRRRVA